MFLTAFAFNQAAAVLMGNQLGEQRVSDAFRSGIVSAGLGVVIVSAFSVFIWSNAPWIAALFSHGQIVVDEIVRYLRIVVLSEPFMAWSVILAGSLNGAGETKSVMVRVVGSLWFVRLPLAYLAVCLFPERISFLWWCLNSSVLAQSILISVKYFSGSWLKGKLLSATV